MAFRRAIEVCDKKLLPCTFSKFPRGSCGDATCLLAKFLEEEGFGQFDYVSGDRGKWSHAWLQQGTLIVDITGDQFDDMQSLVFVATGSEWHDQFAGEKQHLADFEQFGEPARGVLRLAYCAIMDKLCSIDGSHVTAE